MALWSLEQLWGEKESKPATSHPTLKSREVQARVTSKAERAELTQASTQRPIVHYWMVVET